MDSTNFKLTFIYGVDEPQINSRTLLVSLTSFINILETINYKLLPEDNLEIIIDPFEPGSFRVILKGLYNNEETNKEIRGYIMAIFISLFTNSVQQTQVLPQPNNKTEITTKDEIAVSFNGNNFIIPRDKFEAFKNFRTDYYIDENFKKGISALNDDPKVNSIQILADATYVKQEIIIQREDFSNLLTSKVINEDVVNYFDVELKILTLYRDDNQKSGLFIFGDKIILAKIDKYKYIVNQTKLRSGNNIMVSLKEIKKNDLHTDKQIHSSYEIVDIY